MFAYFNTLEECTEWINNQDLSIEGWNDAYIQVTPVGEFRVEVSNPGAMKWKLSGKDEDSGLNPPAGDEPVQSSIL